MTGTYSDRNRRLRHFGARSLVTAMVAVLLLPSVAAAGSGSLRTALASWSKKTGVDARALALDARQRHPVRMTRSALRFRTDALHAKAAIAALQLATARERKAQRLAVSAFADYAIAGSQWAASGRARSHGKKQAAIAHARTAATSATAGSRLLIIAGKLL